MVELEGTFCHSKTITVMQNELFHLPLKSVSVPKNKFHAGLRIKIWVCLVNVVTKCVFIISIFSFRKCQPLVGSFSIMRWLFCLLYWITCKKNNIELNNLCDSDRQIMHHFWKVTLSATLIYCLLEFMSYLTNDTLSACIISSSFAHHLHD